MKILIISANGFEEAELIVPYYRLKEEGMEVVVDRTGSWVSKYYCQGYPRTLGSAPKRRNYGRLAARNEMLSARHLARVCKLRSIRNSVVADRHDLSEITMCARWVPRFFGGARGAIQCEESVRLLGDHLVEGGERLFRLIGVEQHVAEHFPRRCERTGRYD